MKIKVILLLLSLSLSAQNKEDKAKLIKELFLKSDSYVMKDDLKSLKYAKKASLLAEQINDPRLTALSYLIMARSLNNMQMNELSLQYLDKGLKISVVKEDTILYQHFKEFKAENFNTLDLYDQELNEYFDILKLIIHKNSREYMQLRSRIQGRIAYSYYKQKDYDRASVFIDRSVKTQEKLSLEDRTSELYNIYLTKGDICLQINKKDSAWYFYNKAYKIIKKGEEEEYMSLKSFGDYYKTNNDFDNAIKYYTKALEDMQAFNVKDISANAEINKNLSELYSIKGNYNEQKRYLTDYQNAINSEKISNRKNLQNAVNLILSEQKDEIVQKNKKNISYLLAIIGIILFIILALIIDRYLKIKRLRYIEKSYSQKEKILIHEKEVSELQYIEETKKLEKKVNESFDEVFTLAKNNSPKFFTRFREVYPEIINELLLKDQKLRTSELTLCAYFFLGFTTKDIALYTFKSVNTIRNRRQNLRLKLQIPPDEDIELWLKNLVKN